MATGISGIDSGVTKRKVVVFDESGNRDYVIEKDTESFKNSSEEEEELLDTNLTHLNSFLSELEKRGVKDMSERLTTKIRFAKLKLDKIIGVTDSKIAIGSEIRSKKINIGKGAIPKINRKYSTSFKSELEFDKHGKAPRKKLNKLGKKKITNVTEVTDTEDSEKDVSSDSYVSEISDSNERGQDTNSSETASSSNSSSSSNRKKTKKRNNNKKKSIQSLGEALRMFDNRKLPVQEKFDDASGEDLKNYLIKFEKYCECNFRGDRIFWIGELQRHVEGKVLKAFNSIRDVNDTYESLKKKLLEWYNDLKELRTKKNRAKFQNAHYVAGESFYLFSSRLEKIYRVAYPKHNVNKSKVLRDKYVSCLPKSTRKDFNSQIIACKLKNKQINWKTIQRIARFKDVESDKNFAETERDDSDTEVEKSEIVINVGQEKIKAAEQELKRVDMNAFQGRVYQASDFSSNHNNSGGNNNQHYIREFYNQRHYNPYYNHKPFDQRSQYAPCDADERRHNRFNDDSNSFKVDRIKFNRRPTPNIASKLVTCIYCKRFGHDISICRSKLKQCFRCGGSNHMFRNCQNSNFNNYMGSGNNGGVNTGNNYYNIRSKSMDAHRKGYNNYDNRNERERRRRNSNPNCNLNWDTLA